MPAIRFIALLCLLAGSVFADGVYTRTVLQSSAGAASSGGTGNVSGTGTAGRNAYWTGTTTIGADSNITDDGAGNFGVSGTFLVYGSGVQGFATVSQTAPASGQGLFRLQGASTSCILQNGTTNVEWRHIATGAACNSTVQTTGVMILNFNRVSIGTSTIPASGISTIIAQNAAVAGDFSIGCGNTASNVSGTNVCGTVSASTVYVTGTTGTISSTYLNARAVSASTMVLNNIASAAGTSYLCWDSTSKAVSFSNTTCTVSDMRKKENFAASLYGLEEVLAMKPYTYHLKSDKGIERQVGLMAQDLESIIPEAVGHFDDGSLNVNYPMLVPVLVKAIQELEARVQALETP